jgi:hypothetical protein
MTDGADLPDLASVIALLHRADWTRLALSGEVTGLDEPQSPPTAMLHVAPGGRYRRESGPLVSGSDGARAWQWFAGGSPPLPGGGLLLGASEPPFPTLLCPSWLLTGHELTVVERVTACGRPGIRVAGTARRTGRLLTDRGAAFVRELHFGARYEQVTAVIDAELGILLRCEPAGDSAGRRDSHVLEFLSLAVGAASGDALFAAPPGSLVSGDPDGPGGFPAGAPPLGERATSALTGLAARALGAAMRYLPFAKVSSRHPDETGEQMPDDDPPPGPVRAPQSDSLSAPAGAPRAGQPLAGQEILALLYRSGAATPRLTGTLHQWTRRRDSVAQDGDVTTHEVRGIRMHGWFRYRLERAPGASTGGVAGPAVVACDGRRFWAVHADRVSVDDPRPVPAEVADLLDASWLLGCELSGGERVTAGGRAAYRLSVRGRPALGQHRPSELLEPDLPAVAVVDAETGRLLRLTCFAGEAGDQPAIRYELRDAADTEADAAAGAGGDFTFELPDGLRVVRVGADDDRPTSQLRRS